MANGKCRRSRPPSELCDLLFLHRLTFDVSISIVTINKSQLFCFPPVTPCLESGVLSSAEWRNVFSGDWVRFPSFTCPIWKLTAESIRNGLSPDWCQIADVILIVSLIVFFIVLVADSRLGPTDPFRPRKRRRIVRVSTVDSSAQQPLRRTGRRR